MHRNLRHDRVENQRQARRKQHAERAAAGHQTQCAALRMTYPTQQRHQQPAKRENGDAGSAGERGEEDTGHYGNGRRTATEAAEQRVEHAHQALRRAALRQEIAGHGEQRDRRQRGIDDQAVVIQRQRRGGQIGAPKQQQRRAAQCNEHRRPQHYGRAERGQTGHHHRLVR